MIDSESATYWPYPPYMTRHTESERMTDHEHDPLCRYGGSVWHETACSDCLWIAKVRADERERIARGER